MYSNVKVCNTYLFYASLFNKDYTFFSQTKKPIIMLGYMSTITKDALNDGYSKLRFLIGDYDVIAYNSIDHRAWVESGNGTASYTLEDKFLIEKVEIFRKDVIISMHNTIGRDSEKESFHMQTLDITSGIMDIYKGNIKDNVLTFHNIDSTINTQNKDSLNFKLIYKQLSNFENELIVGCSRDNGKTWFPFLKNHYRKKLL